jgi:23S rRNA pseudouridine1911/1915/1917 synthase
LVCAKNDAALANLSAQFAAKTNDREYFALLQGKMGQENIEIESYLYRDPNSRLKFCSMDVADFEEKFPIREDRPAKYRWAKSSFFPVQHFGSRIILAGVKLHTGRTHQIRVHSKDLKTPVIGDQLYGTQMQLPLEYGTAISAAVRGAKRQMLHAKLLGFKHPKTGKSMRFEAEFPNDFRVLLEKLRPFAEA